MLVMQGSLSLSHVYELAKQAISLELESENLNKEPKAHLYRTMGDELETQGYQKEKIYSLMHQILQDEYQRQKKDETVILNNGWLYSVCKESGWTGSSDQKIDNSSVFVRDLKGESVQERKQLIEFLDDLRKEILEEIGTLEMDYYLDDSGNQIKVKWQEYFDDQHKTFLPFLQNLYYQSKEEWRKMFDSRQSILPTMRIPITALVSVVMRKDLAHNYYAKVREIFRITPKKLKQFVDDLTLSGERQIYGLSHSDFFNSLQEDSFLWNFLDIRCPTCHKERLQLRIFAKGEPIWVCKNWTYHNKEETFPMSVFRERIEQLIENKGGSADAYLKYKGIDVVDN